VQRTSDQEKSTNNDNNDTPRTKCMQITSLTDNYYDVQQAYTHNTEWDRWDYNKYM